MIYLYLGRRDKKGIKVLTVFNGQEIGRTLITDIKKIGLPDSLSNIIYNTTHEHRMLWEVWLESAENFKALSKNLKKRGYSDLPPKADPIHQPKDLKTKVISNLPLKQTKTMTERASFKPA